MMIRGLRLLLPVVAGGAAGLIANLVAPKPKPLVEKYYSNSSYVLSAPSAVRAQQQIERPRARAPIDATQALAGDQSSSDIETDPETKRLQIEGQHLEDVHKAREEPRDAAWAPRTEQLFAEDLQPVLKKVPNMTLTGVTCRDTSCLADFRWTDFRAAGATWASVLHGRYRANCTKKIILPEPENKDQPYEATIVFGCGEWKAGGDIGNQP